MEEIFSNFISSFSSIKTVEKKFNYTHVPNNKGASSNSNNEDLKMISIHPDFVEVLKTPTFKSELFNFIPRSVIIENMYARSYKNYGCVIEELGTKDDNT